MIWDCLLEEELTFADALRTMRALAAQHLLWSPKVPAREEAERALLLLVPAFA
jgi:hypothetical protein